MTNYVVTFDGDAVPVVSAMKEVFNRHSKGRISKVYPRLSVITVSDADEAVAEDIRDIPAVSSVERDLEVSI